MADQQISALAVTTAQAGFKLAVVNPTVSSYALYVSTMANFPPTTAQDEGVLFNNAGTLSSDVPTLRYHYSTQALHLGATSSRVWLNHNIVNPPAPPTSTLTFYGRQVAGRMVPKVMGPSAIEYFLQGSFAQQSVWMAMPTTSAAGQSIGGGITNVGTFSSAAPTVGNAYTTKQRGVYFSSSATANLQAGLTGDVNRYFLSSTNGYGGFFFFCRFGLDTYASSVSYYVGLTPTASSAILTSEPASMLNSMGFALSASSGGTSWVFMHSSSGTATTETIAGQTALATGLGYDFYMYTPANTSVVWWRMDELNTGSTIASGSITTHLPNSTSFMKPVAMASNAGVASTGVARIGIIRMYVETDV
jgi:hypothetical protein